MTEGIRLSEALTLSPFARARVVAGRAGLDRVVSQVNVMEVPDILPWVKPNQLLLTTTYPLRHDPAALAALVPGLVERGLAGLAIKPARYIEAIPPAMLDAAERHGFPLIELPADSSFDEVINAVLGSILNIQATRLARSAQIHARFTRIVLTGGGLREIAQVLADLVEQPAAIVDPDGTILAGSVGAVSSGLGAPGSRGHLEPGHVGRAGRWSVGAPGAESVPVVAQPIRVDDERHGAIFVRVDDAGVGGDDQMGDDGLVALEHAATVAALRLVQERVLAEADRRFRAVCLEELVTGHVVDAGVLHERALAFGWDLTRPRAVLLAEVEELSGRRLNQLVGTPDEGRLRTHLAEAVRSALGRDAVVWERSAGAAALVTMHEGGRARLRADAAALQAEAGRRLPGAVVAVGIGQACADPLDLTRSHREALRALVVGRRAHGNGQVSLFEDLGLDRLLASCSESELAQFCEASLGRLIAYDVAHRADLVGTLETFLSCNGNVATAARRLFVHYNTLRNRIATIEHVLGLTLDGAEDRLSLGLALRIWRMLPR